MRKSYNQMRMANYLVNHIDPSICGTRSKSILELNSPGAKKTKKTFLTEFLGGEDETPDELDVGCVRGGPFTKCTMKMGRRPTADIPLPSVFRIMGERDNGRSNDGRNSRNCRVHRDVVPPRISGPGDTSSRICNVSRRPQASEARGAL